MKLNLKFIKRNWFLICVILSVFVGFGFGFELKNLDKESIQWFTLPGIMFIRALEMLIIPVVFFGVVTATGSLNAKSNLKLTLLCFGFCVLTNLLASLTGLAGSIVLINLSKTNQIKQNIIEGKKKSTFDIVADMMRTLIPKNIIKAMTNQESTNYYTNSTSVIKKIEYIDGANVLGVLVFSLLIGFSISILDEKAKLLRDFFKSCNDVIIMILRGFVYFAPIGSASLIIDAIYDVKNLSESIGKIGIFTGICIASILIYGFLILSLMLFIFTRENPIRYYVIFFEPMLLSVVSMSGMVSIQKSIDKCETELKIDSRIARFSIPFYTILQSDGCALYIVLACSFLSIYTGISLSVGDYIVIIFITAFICLCLPSVPNVTIVSVLVGLNSINFPQVNIAILYTVEWLLEKFRTIVMIYSHCFCTVITSEICKKTLKENNDVKIKQEKSLKINENLDV